MTGLHVTGVSSTSVSLDWDSDPSGTRLYYRLYTYAANGSTLLNVHDESSSLGTSSGLAPGTVYVFRASAVFTAGEGPQSNPVTQATSGGRVLFSAADALFGAHWASGLQAGS